MTSAHKALQNLFPACLPHLLPSHSLTCSSPDILPPKHQAHSFLRAFACASHFVRNALLWLFLQGISSAPASHSLSPQPKVGHPVSPCPIHSYSFHGTYLPPDTSFMCLFTLPLPTPAQNISSMGQGFLVLFNYIAHCCIPCTGQGTQYMLNKALLGESKTI